jgi:hypothetical protein
MEIVTTSMTDAPEVRDVSGECVQMSAGSGVGQTTTVNVSQGANPLAAQSTPGSTAGPGSPGAGAQSAGTGASQTLTTSAPASVSVPRAVAAVINIAADDCIFQTYQLDTTSLSQSTLSTLASLAVLGVGIWGTAAHWASSTNTILTTGGAAATLATTEGKLASTPVQATFNAVVQAGLGYYPLLHARASSKFAPGQKSDAAFNAQALSALWDAAGTGCAVGVLKGHAWYD